MNRSEVAAVLEQLKAMFPDWRAWVRQIDSMDATVRVWCEALATQHADDVAAVVAEYVSGRRRPPSEYEYERLVFSIVGAARDRAAAEESRRRNRASIEQYSRDAAQAARDRVETPNARKLTECYRQMRAAIMAVCEESGLAQSQWTKTQRDQYEQRCSEIVAQFRELEGMSRYGSKRTTIGGNGGGPKAAIRSQRELPSNDDCLSDHEYQ